MSSLSLPYLFFVVACSLPPLWGGSGAGRGENSAAVLFRFGALCGAVDRAVGDFDFEGVAFADAAGRHDGFAARADDGEAQPEDALWGAAGDQFRGVVEPCGLPCEEIAHRFRQQGRKVFRAEPLPREQVARSSGAGRS